MSRSCGQIVAASAIILAFASPRALCQSNTPDREVTERLVKTGIALAGGNYHRPDNANFMVTDNYKAVSIVRNCTLSFHMETETIWPRQLLTTSWTESVNISMSAVKSISVTRIFGPPAVLLTTAKPVIVDFVSDALSSRPGTVPPPPNGQIKLTKWGFVFSNRALDGPELAKRTQQALSRLREICKTPR